MSQPPAPPPPPPIPGPPSSYGARPGPVSGGGILLIILGGVRELFAVIALIAVLGASGEISGIPGAGAVIGVAIFAILLTVVVGLLQIFGGVNILQLRRRGRTLGFVGCGIGIALAILGLASGGAAGASVIVSILILLGDIAAIVLLVQSERHLTT